MEKIKKIIDSINMDKIISYLQEGEGLTYAEAVTGSEQYKNYLYLLIKYESEEIPPSYLIQKAWEAHIISCLDEYIKLKKHLVEENSDRLDYKEYFRHKKFITKTSHDIYEEITKKLYLNEFGEKLPTIPYLSVVGKYKTPVLRTTKSLSYYFFLAALTAVIIILIFKR